MFTSLSVSKREKYNHYADEDTCHDDQVSLIFTAQSLAEPLWALHYVQCAKHEWKTTHLEIS